MTTENTLLEIVNHIINKHPNLAKNIEAMSALALGKGFNSPNKIDEINSFKGFLSLPPILGVDIGGNIGDYSEILLDTFPDMEIHIFEPSATNINKLNRKFAATSNVTIVPKGISLTNGTEKLYSDNPGSGMASLTKRNLEHFNITFEHEELITTMPFEKYWENELSKRDIDIVKVDIEGHELDALKSFGSALFRTKIIQFEFGGTHIDTRNYFQDFWYFFKKYNFSIYRITPHGCLEIENYTENDECFLSMNYIAVNNNYRQKIN